MTSARAPLGLVLAACTSAGPSVETGDTPEREGQRETVEATQRCKVGAPPDMPGRRSSLRAWARVPALEHDAYLPLDALRYEVAVFGEHVELAVELDYHNPWSEPITIAQPIVALGWTHVDHVVHVGERAHRDTVVTPDEARLVQAQPGTRVRAHRDSTLPLREVDEVAPGESIRVELSFARRLELLEPGQDMAATDVAPTRMAQLSLPRVGGCVEVLELALAFETRHALPSLHASSHVLERRSFGTTTLLELREGGAQPADVELAWPLAQREPPHRSSRADPRAVALLGAVERMHAAPPWPARGSCFPEPGALEHDLALALALGLATVQTCTIAWAEEAGLRSLEPMQPRCPGEPALEPFLDGVWDGLELDDELDPATRARIDAHLAEQRVRRRVARRVNP